MEALGKPLVATNRSDLKETPPPKAVFMVSCPEVEVTRVPEGNMLLSPQDGMPVYLHESSYQRQPLLLNSTHFSF